MATTAPNLSSLSSCSSFSLRNSNYHVSATSLYFQIPKKRAQISCFGPKNSVFVQPIKQHEMGYGISSVGISQNGAIDSTKVLDRGHLVAVKATEVVAATTEAEAAPKSKSSKKNKVKYPRRILDIYSILQYPVITEAAIKSVAEENALLFTVDVRADKKMIRDAVNNFFGVKVRKVNTSIRPDGTKKAFIMLSKEYNASDIAKSIGIFPK